MACVGCSTGTDGKAAGCRSNGGCATGGCNRMNTYDWISAIQIDDPSPYPLVEISFKNGSNKDFFKKENYQDFITGDWVVVETTAGTDVGQISLSGELVRLQMRKKNVSEERLLYKIIRGASDRDLEQMRYARELEKQALVQGRAMARSLKLDMKLGDVQFQADRKKATFYYTADKRIDFRELVRLYAKEFHTKIEMRQIGARQETARIGGIGSCGRELCCSTWLSDFKTVTTSAARYQNLAINQVKLSGQCGRLKCCLNYELDVYMESLNRFPMEIESLRSGLGLANLLKTDIFKGIMFYELENYQRGKESQIFGLSPEQVRALKAKNDKGEIPSDFGIQANSNSQSGGLPTEENGGFVDVTGEIELPEEKSRRKRRPERSGDNRQPFNTSQNLSQNPNKNVPNQSNNNRNNNQKSNNQKTDINKSSSSNNRNQSTQAAPRNNQNRPPENRQKQGFTERPANRNPRPVDKREDQNKNQRPNRNPNPPPKPNQSRNADLKGGEDPFRNNYSNPGNTETPKE